jgi:hypothetical protein
MRARSGILLALAAALAAIPLPSEAAVRTRAEYNVSLSAVTSPNSSQVTVPGASDSQTVYDPQPPPIALHGFAEHFNVGYGFATGNATLRAAPGILGVEGSTEAQAVARPDTNVGAGAVVTAYTDFIDALTFIPAHSVYDDLLIINGELILTGDMSTAGVNGGYVMAAVGGTGLSPTSTQAEWIGELTRQKSAAGVYSDWTPGDPVSIPFSFTVYANQPFEVQYWLRMNVSSGGSFPICESLGGLCNVVQIADGRARVDYGHTLTWHLTEATDWFETPVDIDITSSSGFDYLLPEPGAVSALVAIAALVTLRRAKRRAR